MPDNFNIQAILRTRDEDGNLLPSRWDNIVAERKRKAEREARKAARRAGTHVKRAPNQFEIAIAALIGIGLFAFVGWLFHVAVQYHP